MDNFTIYKKTLCFSFRKILFDFLMLLLIAGMCVGGFLIADKAMNNGLIGLGVGLILGCIVAGILSHFLAYALKAGQIAMMTRAITDGELPDNVYAEGKKVVKERFLTVAAFYAVTNIIKGIFNQIGRAITGVGKAIGGDAGQGIGSAISSAIQILVGYLCDCCLGWVFYRKEQGSVRATLEGAVLFFKHGKTLMRNVGRIFGIGLLSLAVVGGAFFGITFLIFSFFPAAFVELSQTILETGAAMETEIPTWVSNPTYLALVVAAIIGVSLWSFVHSNFIRPFILAGVLRNYIKSGMEDIPTEESFKMLDGKSKKFADLHAKLDH